MGPSGFFYIKNNTKGGIKKERKELKTAIGNIASRKVCKHTLDKMCVFLCQKKEGLPESVFTEKNLHSLEKGLIKIDVLQMAAGKKRIGPSFEKRHQQ